MKEAQLLHLQNFCCFNQDARLKSIKKRWRCEGLQKQIADKWKKSSRANSFLNATHSLFWVSKNLNGTASRQEEKKIHNFFTHMKLFLIVVFNYFLFAEQIFLRSNINRYIYFNSFHFNKSIGREVRRIIPEICFIC